MNKLIKITAIISAVFALNAPLCFAATSQSTTISAAVDQQLTLDMAIKAEDPVTHLPAGANLSAMNFGTLVRSTNPNTGAANALRGSVPFHVFFGANSSGRPYKVSATVSDLTGTGGTLPHALGVFGAQVTTDGNPANPVTGGTLISGAGRYGAGTYDVYSSNAQGQAGVIEIVYGISGGNADGSSPFTGWQAIPPSQPSGTYSGTATYTITLT